MKKLITGFGVALALFSFNGLQAQTLLGGIKGGVNHSSIKGFNDNSESKISPSGGIFFQYGEKEHLKYNIELLYSPRGINYTLSTLDSVTKISKRLDYDIQFHYIDVPILVSYNFFSDSAKFRPRVYAGPTFGIRFDAKREISYNFTQNDSILSEGVITDENIANEYSPVDVAVAVGAGATYAITSKIYAVVDIRYIRSISDLSENVTNKNSVINSTISGHVGVAYRFGSK